VIQGYDGSMGTHLLGLVPRQNYRIRYSIANVARLDDTAASPSRRYRLQFWPVEESPPAVLTSKTTWGQFVQYDRALEQAASAAALLPEAERLDSYLDEAVSVFPGDRQGALENDTLATLASRKVWALKIGKADETAIRIMVAERLN
jgi:hypothetical protein